MNRLIENHEVEEEGRSSSRQGKCGRENMREVMGREQKSSKVCETGKVLPHLCFLSENCHVASKWN